MNANKKLSPKNRYGIPVVFLLAVFLVFGLVAGDARAAVWTVTSNTDAGAGSLRNILGIAASGDAITFNGNYTIVLESALIIDKNLTIDGTGRMVTVSGDNLTRMFFINRGSAVTIKGIRLVNGFDGYTGGGIYNDGTLTLENCSVSGCVSRYGGGIYSIGDLLTLNNCTFFNNEADLNGGGVYSIYAALTMTNCTFSGNHAPNGGGAVYNVNDVLTLTNCTVYQNTADNNGAGIASGGVLNLRNTIVAENMAGIGADNFYRFAGTYVSNGGNLSDNWNGLLPEPSDITADPLLLPFSECAGGLWVYPIEENSPALDAGVSGGPASDQCGHARIGAPDSGAFEFQFLPPHPPSDLTAGAVSETEIDLSWTDNSADETGFNIYRLGVLIGSVGPNITSYSDAGLSCGVTYSYQVKAENAYGESAPAAISGATAACPLGPAALINYIFDINDTESGKIIPLTAFVKNTGTEVFSSAVRVAFYMNGPVGFAGGKIGEVSAEGLNIGYSINYSINWQIPLSAPGGVYTCTAQVWEDTEPISPLSEEKSFTVTPAAVFTAEILRIMPSTVTAPTPAVLKVLVRNNGADPLNGAVKFYVNGAEAGTAAITNLAPGGRIWYTFSWPTAGQQGTHTYTAQVFDGSDAAISKMSGSAGITVY